ncbi:hypothetical protein Cantr_10624 [Candida viswanathii]|uniref:Uncharacterized protein n=1 Tax=Candida viswanathii TaxID=5486 RepID=A0A367YDS3_9ASCO|nr:hypothetical protein Cantr_10624 [Candida viswanathii]
MVFGFNNLLGSPQGNGKKPSGLEFTPIGKRNGDESSFQVMHTYPKDYSPLSTNGRKLFQPLAESNNIAHYSQESGLFDETIEDFEKMYPPRHPLPKKQTRSPVTRRGLIGAEDDAGIAAKQLEETIKELRLENYGWKIKYKELRRSLENMPQLESDVRKANIELTEQVATLKQQIQQLKQINQDYMNNKENSDAATIVEEKNLAIQQLNDEIYRLKKRLSSQQTAQDSNREYEEMIQELQIEREELRGKIQELEDYMNHAETEFDEQESKIHHLEDELTRVRSTQTQEASKDAVEQIHRLDAQVQELEEKNELLEETIATLELRLSKEVRGLEADIVGKSELIDRLQREIESLESNGNQAEEHLRMELIGLREELEKKQHQLDKMEREKAAEEEHHLLDNEAFNEKCERLESELEIAHARASSDKGQREELAKLKRENRRLQNDYEEQCKKVENLNEDLTERRTQIEIYEKEFEKVNSELKDVRKSLELAERELLSARRSKELVSSELEQLKRITRDYDDLKNDYDSYQESKAHEISQLKLKIRQQEDELSRMHDNIERLQNSVVDKSELHADNVQLAGKLESSWKEIEDLQTQLHEMKITNQSKEKEMDYEIEARIGSLNNQILDLKEENARLKLKVLQSGTTRELFDDNVELAERAREAESARIRAEKKMAKLENEVAELLVELDSQQKYSLEDTYIAELKQEIVKLRGALKVSDDYILELESKARNREVDQSALERLQHELESSASLVKSQETKIKYLETELQKGVAKASEPSVLQEYAEFQLKTCREELEKATNALQAAEQKYSLQLKTIKEEKQSVETDFIKSKSKNTQLNVELESTKEELQQMTRNCKRLAKKVSEHMQARKKLDSPEWIQFLENESIYFKAKFMEEFTRKSDYKFLYNYAVRSIKNSTKLLSLTENNANLVKLGIYPEYVNQAEEKRPKLTFAGLAKFVLASVRIKRRTKTHLATLRDIQRVRSEIDVARISFS